MGRKIKVPEYTGGLVDTSLSGKALSAIKSVPSNNDEELLEKIALAIGRYRMMKLGDNTSPTKELVEIHIKETIACAEKLQKLMALMPQNFEALADEGYWHVRKSFFDTARRVIDEELIFFNVISKGVLSRIKAMPTKRGNKKHIRERRLLSDITKMLEPYYKFKYGAAEKSAAILKLAGVKNIPTETKKITEAISNYREDR